MRINLNVDDLIAFAEVAQKLSYKAAADNLGMSPSALSRRIQKLEEGLNVQLLVRTTRDVKLTPAGKQLQRASHDIINNAEELYFALRGESYRNLRTIRVGCVASAMGAILVPAMAEIISRYPNAQVKIVDSTAVHILDSLFQQDIDFCVNYLGQDENGVDFEPVLEDPFVVAVRKDHAFGPRNMVDWEELGKERTIAARHGAGVRMLIDVGLAKSRKKISWSYEVQHVNAALALVQQGLGVAVVPRICVQSSPYPDLIGVPLRDAAVSRTLGLVRIGNAELRPLAKELWAIIAERGKALNLD